MSVVSVAADDLPRETPAPASGVVQASLELLAGRLVDAAHAGQPVELQVDLGVGHVRGPGDVTCRIGIGLAQSILLLSPRQPGRRRIICSNAQARQSLKPQR